MIDLVLNNLVIYHTMIDFNPSNDRNKFRQKNTHGFPWAFLSMGIGDQITLLLLGFSRHGVQLVHSGLDSGVNLILCQRTSFDRLAKGFTIGFLD